MYSEEDINSAVAAGARGSQGFAQLGFHRLEVFLGAGAAGLAFVGDAQAVFDRADQVGIGFFHGLDVEHTAFHFLSNHLVAFAQVGGIRGQ